MAIESSWVAQAARQGGYISRRQLRDLGYSDSSIDRRVQAHELTPVGHGVYQVFVDIDPKASLWAPILGLSDAVVSHRAAAGLHGISPFERSRPEVTVHAAAAYRMQETTVHRVRDLTAQHRMRLGGLPVTTIARTVFDLATVLDADRLGRVIEDVVLARMATLDELQLVVDEVGRRGKPGTSRIRDALESRGIGPISSATALERLGRQVLIDGGLPVPVAQYQPHGLKLTLDAAYPEARLGIEWDSLRWHSRLERFETDRRRDRAAAERGWLVLRFTWDDLRNRPGEVCRQVRSVIDLRLGA
ncbi:MAG: type IV toxin-antitoxin system AbiEi family antitoxin domain-containing protein [Acidimicrobiia bacterium]|nr:type IV toxin-antitoxin system AbiEi family antitoxin domain-containing protein [Acidimicrobiia bacterium]